MTFSVTILGCSSAMPSPTRHHTAHLLNVHEQHYLVDCGEGTQYQLARYRINPLKINHIFLSHLHGDHTYGIFGLISTMAMVGRSKALNIYAPAPFREMLESHMAFYDIVLPYQILFTDVNARENTMIYENRVMEVWSIPLRHRIACSGYLFREKSPALKISKEAIMKYDLDPMQIVQLKNGNAIELDSGEMLESAPLLYAPYTARSYAFCSDTTPSGKVAAIVKGVTLLYHESTYLHKDRALALKTGHTTALQAAKLAARASVENLLLGHYSSRYKELDTMHQEALSEFPSTHMATDGMVIKIGENHDVEVK